MSVPSLAVRWRVEQSAAASPKQPGQLLDLARAAEAAGADCVLLDGERRDIDLLDPYTLLAAVSAATSTVAVGCVASPVGERSPSVLARTIAALDVCSNGRALACLAPGDLSGDSDPLGELAEALAVVRLMLEARGPSFAGTHFVIDKAWNEPRHVRAASPLGVLIPRPSAPHGGMAAMMSAELVVAVAEHVSFVVTEPSNPPLAALVDVAYLALVDMDKESYEPSLAAQVDAAREAGFLGVVLDWTTLPATAEVEEAVAAVRS